MRHHDVIFMVHTQTFQMSFRTLLVNKKYIRIILEVVVVVVFFTFIYCFRQCAIVVLRSRQLSPAESWRFKQTSYSIVLDQRSLCYYRLLYRLLTTYNKGMKYSIKIYHTLYLLFLRNIIFYNNPLIFTTYINWSWHMVSKIAVCLELFN